MGSVSRVVAAVLIAAASSLTVARAADICEGCWELGGEAGVLLPSEKTGMEPAAGLGGFGAFHFRPYWAVEFSLDRHPGQVEDGPDETVTLFLVRGAYTFRSARDQRHRPYGFFGVGLGFDQVGTSEASVSTGMGQVSARTGSDSDAGVAYALGGGVLTSLKGRLWLRSEAHWVGWSTFGIGQGGFRIMGTLTWRLGR